MTSKFALIIANTEYQDASFARLTAPGKDADEFAQVLRDAELAGFDDVQVLINEGEGKTRRSIARFFAERKRDDLMLLYFSGHGVRNEQGQLFLAANDTEINILEASGIPAEFVTQSMNNSRSQRQLLILDCCNSGAFAHGSKSAAGVGKSMGIATAFEGSGFGRVVLTATDATQYAWEGDKVIGDTQKSVFTHFLIEGLRGAADRDGDGRIDVDELYDYTYEQVVRRTPKQTPGKWSYKQQGEIILRENLKPRDVKPASLPVDTLELLSSSSSRSRNLGLQDLTELLNGKHIGLARAAEDKLREIAADDDSLSLRKTASDILTNHGLSEDAGLVPKTTDTQNENLAREKAELESKEKLARENAKREALAKTEREKIQRDQMERDAAKRAAFQKTEREAAQKVEPKKTIGKSRSLALGGFALFIIVGLFVAGAFIISRLQSAPPTPTQDFAPTVGPAATVEPATIGAATEAATLVIGSTEAATLVIGSTMTGNDGATLMYVPAGEFLMGSTAADTLASEDEKPQHPVTLDAFWIDQTEVTNNLFSSFISATGYQTDAEKTGSSYVYDGTNWVQTNGANWQRPTGSGSDISGKEKYPVIHLSWNDAVAYCEWSGRRLPTEAEWEKAASWNDLTQEKYIYPWGNDFNGSIVNFCDKNCTFDWADKNSDDGFVDTSPVKNYPDGVSPYGAYDMAGNVWEWVNDWYDVYPSGDKSASTYFGQTYRVLRGGSWNISINLVRSADRNWNDPTSSNDGFGFRCARSLP